jgi:membrane protein DedA with SNARE-associated domain
MQADVVLLLISQYRYAFLVPGALFIGPLVSLTAGALIRIGVLDLTTTALVLMSTELLGDVFWYWVGSVWGEPFISKFGRLVGISEFRVSAAKILYKKHHDLIIIISKLTAGFGFAPAIYFTAGLSKVPFGRYMIINTIGQIIWTFTMLGIGYYLGHFYLQVNGALEKLFFITSVIVIVAIIGGFGRSAWKRYTQSD